MSRAVVERHDSVLGRWEAARRPAHAALAPHVLGYVGYEETMPGGFRRLEPSNDEVHVIFSFGPECRVPERVCSFVAATDIRHAVVEHDGRQHGVELRLTPLGAHMLLGIPMDELTCRVVALDALLGLEADRLIEHMHGAGSGTRPTSSAGTSWDRTFDVMDDWLLRRLADARRPHPAVEGAWARLVRSHGNTPVSELVQETGWSGRHLAARFREFSGRTPIELMAARLPDGGYRG